MSNSKVRLNTEWLCDCGGCHVAIVDLHEKILQFLESVQIQKCPVLTDEKLYPEAEIGIVTGSIRTEHDRHAALEMRKKCKTIIAFGTCAVYGGLHGAGLAHSKEEIIDHVYKKCPTTKTDTVPATAVDGLEQVVIPIDEVIDVDLYMPGCPPHAHFIFEALTAIVEGREPSVRQESICGACNRVMKKTEVAELKSSVDEVMDEELCFLSQGHICLGSVTLDRCLAPCPNHGIMCTGCAGPTMQILTEPNRDLRTEVSQRMSQLTSIPAEAIKARMEQSAKTHYAYAMATKMIGNKPTFLIRKWIADVEAS
ncbi:MULTISPECIES: methyl viologen-reducing hydrogenase [Desulfosediminicola]|uniref:NADH-quinone oxidoreductase subunit B family protein n=1 Tax=Desulfosediminicola TaxID=2886823 RepID=UPI0010AC2A49|nr:methyl viologen-reducing hydrogenase [Desulfosediminicola ganghwensis]